MISIIIPAFITTSQQRVLLDETLTTVDEQTRTDYEVLLVDDGSPFDVRSVVEQHPRVRMLQCRNRGPAHARNAGVAASRGSYLVFLDADDHLLPEALDAGRRALDDRPEAGFVVGPREEMTFEGGPVSWPIASPPQRTNLYETLLAFDWYIIPPSSVMFTRDAVAAVGDFRDPWGADDLDFYLRAAWMFPGWCYDAPAVTRYRRYSTSSSRDGERMLRSIRAVYQRQRAIVERNPHLEAAYLRGLARLTDIFVDCLVENVRDRVRAQQWRGALHAAVVLASEKPARLFDVPRRHWVRE
jgi:glycosyltransferase involved in cell wall biosynthesis